MANLKQFRYTFRMRKTTLLIDDRLLTQARDLLGTRSIRQTVERALQELISFHARLDSLDQLRTIEGLDLDRPEVMDQAWR